MSPAITSAWTNSIDPGCAASLQRYRYHDPVIGRFTSFDTFEADAEEVQHQHKYNYAGADPVNNVDPGGHDFFSAVGQVVNRGISALLSGLQAVGIRGAILYARTTAAVAAILSAASQRLGGVSRLARISALSSITCSAGRPAALTISSARKTCSGSSNASACFDRPQIRDAVAQHLNTVLRDPTNVVRLQENARVVKESLLMGPYGGVKLETIWEGTKLITIKVFGG